MSVTPPAAPTASTSRSKRVAKSEFERVVEHREMFEAIEWAKLRRATALADKQELENQQLRSRVIPTINVREWDTRFLAYSRDELLTGPSELQDALALEPDPAKCAAILRAWLERVMTKWYQFELLWGEGDIAGEGKIA